MNIPIELLGDLKLYLKQVFAISYNGVVFEHGNYGMRTLRMQMGALRYMMKALDHRAFRYYGFDTQNFADALGIQHTGTDGLIQAKRAGCTQNISPAARRRANWRELRDLDELGAALNPAGTTNSAA